MKKVSVNAQIKEVIERALAGDDTALEHKTDVGTLKIDIEILKRVSVENSKFLAEYERILNSQTREPNSHTPQFDYHSKLLEDLNTKVDFLVEGVSEIIREFRESKQLM